LGYRIDNLFLYSVWLCHYWTYRPVEYICTICTVYTHFYTVHTHLYTIYLYIFNAISCKRLISTAFGMVHSNRNDVVLLHIHFSSWLRTFCNSMSIIMNSTYATMSKSNITAYVTNLFTFYKSAYYVQYLFNTDCILLIFHLDCTRWCRFTYLTHFVNKHQCCCSGN
jgi:hypothetical protein